MNDTVCAPINNYSSVVTSIVSSQDGRYLLGDIDNLFSDFQKTIITIPSNANNLSMMIESFGSSAVYESIKNLNTLLSKDDTVNLLADYPSLNERLSTNIPITPVEYAEFTSSFLYTPASLNFNVISNYKRVISELNEFFTSNFTSNSMGSFCSIAPSVFGAIGGFFYVLDNFKDVLSKISNVSVANLLSQLKDNIKRTIEKVIEKVKKIIENFTLSSITNGVQIFTNENIITKVMELKEAALRFFTKENIDKLKSKVDGLINYAISLFKDPSIEEIQYLIYRFCNFMTQIEYSINSVKNPLDSFASNYQSSFSILSKVSNVNTANAIAAGAIRYSIERRKAEYDRIIELETISGNARPIAANEIDGVTPWNNGRGDNRIGFQGRWVSAVGEEGWTRVSPKARILLMRVQEIFGRKLLVNSGYRPPQYNKSIGGSSRSLHMAGLALDITWSGINIENREEFITIARKEGFGGIGRYGTRFVHIDLGAQRNWSG